MRNHSNAKITAMNGVARSLTALPSYVDIKLDVDAVVVVTTRVSAVELVCACLVSLSDDTSEVIAMSADETSAF